MSARNTPTALGFGDKQPPRRRRKLRGVRWVRRGKLLAFVDVQFGRLKLLYCAVFVGASGAFVALPQCPVLDEQGSHKCIDGTLLWTPIAILTTRQARDRFSKTVLDLLHREYPDLLAHQPTLPLGAEGEP